MSEKAKDFITVSALSKYISQKFERDPHLQRIRVVGEISNYRHRPNNHQYFSLKEGQVQINAIMFKSYFQRLKFTLEEGMKVYVTARVGVYEGGGRYQLYVEAIEPDGVGSLFLALEQLKDRLRKEGLFDLPKKPLARFPKRLAVITSPSGAVVRDIITTINRRYPIVEVVVFPTRVQGNEAVDEMIAAFQAVHYSNLSFDAILLARGGGSIEDLWCFNDEKLARVILQADIPVISSIGHETDTTIADLVADLRAPTPTAAAELSVPVLQDIYLEINLYQQRLIKAIRYRMDHYLQRYHRSSQSYIFSQPDRLYQNALQNLAYLNERLIKQSKQHLHGLRQQVQHANVIIRLHNPQQQIAFRQERLSHLNQQLSRAIKAQIEKQAEQTGKMFALLDAYSPLKIMARGYSLVERGEETIHSSQQLSLGDQLILRFAEGQAQVDVIKIENCEKE